MCIVIYQILLLAIATKIKLSIELTPGFAIYYYYYNNYSNARSISTMIIYIYIPSAHSSTSKINNYTQYYTL